MHSHRLLRLDDNKFAASCQQACCKLIVKTFYPKASCKFFQQLEASLKISVATSMTFTDLLQLVDNLQQAAKVKSVVFLVGMGTIPIPSIDTVDACELEVSIDTSTKYR